MNLTYRTYLTRCGVFSVLLLIPCFLATAQIGSVRPLSTTESFLVASDTVTYAIHLGDTTRWDRRLPYWLTGVNWGTYGWAATNSAMGQTIVDDHANAFHKKAMRPGSRLIVSFDDTYSSSQALSDFGHISWAPQSVGYAKSSRLDPELDPEGASGMAVLRAGDRTGAIRTYAHRHDSVLIVDSIIRLLPSKFTVPTRVLYGNPDSTLLGGIYSGSGSEHDTSNGNDLWLSVQVRRKGSPSLLDTANDNDVVLELSVSAFKDVNSADSNEDVSDQEVLFRKVPRNGTLNHVVTTPVSPSGTSLSTSPTGFAWEGPGAFDVVPDTVENIEDYPFCGSIKITSGMLRVLPVDTTSSDSSSVWCSFSAFIQFRDEDRNEDYFANAFLDGPNKREDVDRLKSLRISVDYSPVAAVDVDWTWLRTPVAKKLMEDGYRLEIARAVAKLETALDSIEIIRGLPRGSYRVLGIRSVEERDHDIWWSQRYMMSLLDGFCVTEQAARPYRHWRQNMLSDVTERHMRNNSRMPIWHWTDYLTAPPREQTAAPYVAAGYPYRNVVPSVGHGMIAGHGLKYGVENTFTHMFRAGAPRALGNDAISYRHALSRYEISWGLLRHSDNPSSIPPGVPYDVTWVLDSLASGVSSRDDFDYHYLKSDDQDAFAEKGNYDAPLQLLIEKSLVTDLVKEENRDRFFDGSYWIPNLWYFDRYEVDNVGADPNNRRPHVLRARSTGKRVQTAEEVRLQTSYAVVLGAAGYLTYLGSTTRAVNDQDLSWLIERGGYSNHRRLTFDADCQDPASDCRSAQQEFTDSTSVELHRVLAGHDSIVNGQHRYGNDFATPVTTAVPGEPAGRALRAAMPWSVYANNSSMDTAHRWPLFIDSTAMFCVSADRYRQDSTSLFENVSAPHVDLFGLTVNGTVDFTKFFTGQNSARGESYRILRSLRQPIPAPSSWQSSPTDTTWSQRLARLRLVSWYGKGYTEQSSFDDRLFATDPLHRFVDRTGIRTRHPYEPFATVPSWESKDSAFFDITILQQEYRTEIAGADTVAITRKSLDEEFYLGVINRRTNPLIITADTSGGYPFGRWRFVTPEIMRTEDTLREKPFLQLGSRQVKIPLAYYHPDGRPRLIRVTEMPIDPAGDLVFGDEDTTFHARSFVLDTIVDALAILNLRFLPGEGKLFRCVVLPAADEIDDGYLAYSTQNKMVAYPVRRPNGTWSDSIRYHVVFHRNDAPKPAGTGITSVFYARSVPYRRDSLPDVAGLTFAEPPVNISVTTFFNKDAVRYHDKVNKNTYVQRLQFTNPQADTCSCAFPSITISPAEIDTSPPTIHVVYVCGDWWTHDVYRPEYAHVVENVFPDLLNQPVPKNNGKSLVVIHRKTGTADTLAGLSTAGMPVVNTAHGRNFYAWTSWGGFLGVGHKRSNVQYFPQTMGVNYIPDSTVVVTDTTLPRAAYVAGQPKFPSINVYSNLARMDSTASVVWQSGDHIRYTRLRPNNTSDINHYLPPFKDMAYANLPGAWVDVDTASRVAVISRIVTGDSARMPVVLRSLQADTMRMYVSDTTRTPALDTILDYETESIAWEEHLAADDRAVIRTRHLVDVTSAGQHAGAYYWGIVTTYSPSRSLFHPVITQGAVRLDSLTWQGWIGNTLWTYGDSLKVLRGNISDSAVLVCYNAMTLNPFRDLRDHADAHQYPYWSGASNFGSLMTQQIEVPPLARVPGFPSPITHTRWLKASGAWPHLSARRREDTPDGISSVRRILQYDTLTPPSIFISAEQFYRLGSIPGFTDEPYAPREFVGLETAMADVTIAAALRRQETGNDNAGDNEDLASRLRFRCVFANEDEESAAFHDTPWSGNEKLRHVHASMTQRLTSVVSEPFVVNGSPYEEYDLVVDVLGTYRDDVHLVLDEVEVDVDAESADASRNGGQGGEQSRDRGTSVRTRVVRSLDVGLPSVVGDNMPQQQRSTSYALTGGEGRLWRLRLTSEPWVRAKPHVELDISPTQTDLARHALQTQRHIDLTTLTMSHLDANSDIFLMPNPTSSRVRCGLRTSSAAGGTMRLQCVTATGTIVADLPITANALVDIDGLSSGTYSVRVVTNDGQPTLIRPRMLVVVR